MGTLEVRSLSRIREGVLLFDEVSFTVPDGHVAALAGPVRAGKTSLLRVIAGIERSDAGDVVLDGQSLMRLPTERRGVGFLFDDLALFEDMTVRENVAFGLRMQRRKRVDRLRRTDDVLEALGLGTRSQQKPRDLSPGERKRLAFARAVAPEPELLLLDEPTFGVEEVGRDAWRQELGQALRTLGVTTLIATTDLRDAVMLADELLLMAEGQLVQTGAVSRVLQGPVSIEAALLTGYVPLVRGDVVDGLVVEPGVGSIVFPAGLPLRQHAAVMAHPTALFGVPGGSGLGSGVSGTLLRARSDGPVYVVEVQLNGRSVSLRWEWDLVPPQPGTAVEIAVRPGTLRFFNDTPAHRVRGVEVSALPDPQRFASLTRRSVAGANALGPAMPQLPLSETARVAEPEDPGAELETESQTRAQAQVEAEGEASEPAAPAQIEGPSAQQEARDELPYIGAPAPVEPGGIDEASPVPTAPIEDEPILPARRPEARTHEQDPTVPDESLPSPAAPVEPVRPRPTRPTLSQVEIEEVHTSSYGPAPATPAPQTVVERHGGMPLD